MTSGVRTIFLITICTMLRAQSPPAAAPGEPDQFTVGFSQRVRTEDWNNLSDYSDKSNDEREQMRYRTRLWVQAPLSRNLTMFVGLNQETNEKLGQVTKFDEVVFDQFYLDFHPAVLPGWALRAGRQNLTRGEGFILFDGTSGDGSRTQYFNAVVLSREFGTSRLEFMGILDPARDRFLPAMNTQHKLLTEWNESAVGTYFTHKQSSGATWESYYFLKKEYGDTRAASNPQFQPDRHVHTIGGRGSVPLAQGLRATAEFAAQWGFQRPNRNVTGWGGYGYLKKSFETAWKPTLQAGYWAMSDQWDPLFSRWPKWSELVIYSQVKERGVSYWTNMILDQAELTFRPAKKLNGRFTYYHTTAFMPFSGSKSMFGRGTTRGDNLQTQLTWTIDENWKGHALYEAMLPGDFYANHRYAYFVRFEMEYQLKLQPKLYSR